MTIPDLEPLHEDMTFLTALAEEHADRLVAWLAAGLSGDEGPAPVVVDAGCGWAELLLRVVAAAPGARGIGADLDAASIEEGRRRATERGLADRVRLEQADAVAVLGDLGDGGAQALVAIGASQVWGGERSEPGPVPYRAALSALRAAVRRGGRVLYGEAVWSRPPTPEATTPLSGRADELVQLPQLVSWAGEHGFVVAGLGESTQAEFDEFEGGFTRGYVRWLVDHATDHPAAEEVRGLLRAQQAAYLDGYRGFMTIAYLQLVAV